MSPRVKPSRILVEAYRKPWSPLYEELFDLPGADWKRPAEVHVRPTRAGFTVTARFLDPQGLAATAVARIKRTSTGATQISETLSLPKAERRRA